MWAGHRLHAQYVAGRFRRALQGILSDRLRMQLEWRSARGSRPGVLGPGCSAWRVLGALTREQPGVP